MGGRSYTFTRAWAAISVGLGWLIILAGGPVGLALISFMPPTAPAVNRQLFVVLMTVLGILSGLLLGGGSILWGQRLQIALASLDVQTRTFDLLSELAHRRAGDPPAAGRFGGLAGE